MKVIFLDIDGVLNSGEYMIEIKDCRHSMSAAQKMVDMSCLRNLRRIVDETGARIVVTSSVRKEPEFNEFKEYISHEGLRVHDVTLDFGDSGIHRGDEIREWLKKHSQELERFVILDDDTFPDFNELQEYCIQPRFHGNRGIEEKHVQMAIERLGSIREKLMVGTEYVER